MEITFDTIAGGRIAVTRLSGPAGDRDVPAFYQALVDAGHTEDTRPQLIDGRQVTEVDLTRSGMEQMASRLSRHASALRLRRVALLSDRDLVYGLFRMWEAQRAEFGGDARVFRDEAEAVAWLLGDEPADG